MDAPCAGAANLLAHPDGPGRQAGAGHAPGPAQRDVTGWQMPSSQQIPKTPSLGRRGPSCPPTGCPWKPRAGQANPAPWVLGAVWGGGCVMWQIPGGSSGPAAARHGGSHISFVGEGPGGPDGTAASREGGEQPLRVPGSSEQGPRWEATARRRQPPACPRGHPRDGARRQGDCAHGVTARQETGLGRNLSRA